jgi:hypothetical protein
MVALVRNHLAIRNLLTQERRVAGGISAASHPRNTDAVATAIRNVDCQPNYFRILRREELESKEFRLKVREALDYLVELNPRNPYAAFVMATLCLENGVNYEIEGRRSFTGFILNSLLEASEDDCSYLLAKAVESGLDVPNDNNNHRNLVLVALRSGHFDTKNTRVQGFLSKQIEVYSNPRFLNGEIKEDFQKRMMLAFEIAREILKQKVPISNNRSIEDVLSGLRKTGNPTFVKLAFVLLDDMWTYVDVYKMATPDARSIHKMFVDATKAELVDLSDDEMGKRVAVNASKSLDKYSQSKFDDGQRMFNTETFDILSLKLKNEGAIEEALLTTLACERNGFYLPDLAIRNTIVLAELLDGDHVQAGIKALKRALEVRDITNTHFERATQSKPKPERKLVDVLRDQIPLKLTSDPLQE